MDGTYRDPTKFQTLLKNAVNRGYVKPINLRRDELLNYLEDSYISPDMIRWVRNNREIVGERVWQKFQSITAMPAGD